MKRRQVLSTALITAVTLGALALLARSVDRRALLAALRGADLGLIGGAVLAAVVLCLGSGTLRLHALLAAIPGERPRRRDLWPIYVTTTALSNVLPTAASEVARAVQLGRRYGHAAGVLTVVMLAEKLLEAFVMGAGMLLVGLAARLSRPIAGPLVVTGGLAVVGVPLVMLLAWRWQAWAERGPARWAFFARVADGLRQLRTARTWLVALGWSLVFDLGIALSVGFILAAVGIRQPPAAWYVVVLVSRIAGLIPAAPGQLGVQEAGIVVAQMALGAAPAPALAVALLYRVVHLVPVTLLALTALPGLLADRGGRAPAAPTGAAGPAERELLP